MRVPVRASGLPVHFWYWSLVSGSWSRRKAPDNFIVRAAASFLEKVEAEKPRLRHDNEPAMGQFAKGMSAFPHPSFNHFGANQPR